MKARDIWNIAGDALTLPRFEFIARFVERSTATKKGREPVANMIVRRSTKGWTYGFHNGPAMSAPTQDAARLFENIRRTPLGFYTRLADEFRADVFEAAQNERPHR